jgi:hypothetical protein
LLPNGIIGALPQIWKNMLQTPLNLCHFRDRGRCYGKDSNKYWL